MKKVNPTLHVSFQLLEITHFEVLKLLEVVSLLLLGENFEFCLLMRLRSGKVIVKCKYNTTCWFSSIKPVNSIKNVQMFKERLRQSLSFFFTFSKSLGVTFNELETEESICV